MPLRLRDDEVHDASFSLMSHKDRKPSSLHRVRKPSSISSRDAFFSLMHTDRKPPFDTILLDILDALLLRIVA